MNTKTTLILALVAVAIIAYLYFVDQPWVTDDGTEPTTVVKALFDPQPEDTDRIEVVGKDFKQVFEKENNKWVIREPIKCPAQEYQVNSIVETVAKLKYVKEYDKGDDGRPSAKVSGLEKPTAQVKLFKKGELQADLVVGARIPMSTGTYIQLAGSDKILETNENIIKTLTKKLDQYRNKRIAEAQVEDVQRIKIEGMQNYEIVKSGEEYIIESPIKGRADKNAASSLIRAFTFLNVMDWVEDQPKSNRPYGLDKPSIKVTMDVTSEIPPKAKPGDPDTKPADTQPSTESKTYVLTIGGAGDTRGSKYFAKIDYAPWIFAVNENTYKQLSKPLAELFDKDVAKIDQAKVTDIAVQNPLGSLKISKNKDNKWVMDGEKLADQAAVTDLLVAVDNLKANTFADPGSQDILDWSKPRAKITLNQKGQLKPVVLLVGAPTASGKMIHVRNAGEEAVAIVREEDVAQLMTPSVSYQDRNVLKFQRGRVKTVKIERAGLPQVVAAKENNLWAMTAPIKAQAENEVINNLLRSLSALRAKRVVDIGNQAKYGLDNPAVTVEVEVQPITAEPNTKVVGTQPTTKPATKPAADKTTPQGMSNKDLLKHMETLPNPNPKMRELLEKLVAQEEAEAAGTQPAATQPAKKKPVYTYQQLLDYLNTLPNANPKMRKLLEDLIAKEKTGKPTTEPAAETKTVVKPAPPAPEAKPTIYRIALNQKNDKTYACLKGRNLIYELDKKIYEDAMAEIHNCHIAKFEVDKATGITFKTPNTDITLHKSGDEWTYLTDSHLPIDKQKVNDVINSLCDIQTHRYVDYDAADLAKYKLDSNIDRLIITLEGTQKIQILLSQIGPAADPDKSRYALRAGTRKVFLLKGEIADKFAQKLEDFEKKTE